MSQVDTLYASCRPAADFQFDQQVAEVFPDMIRRSVPGYEWIIENIEGFARQFAAPNSYCYDLGCSLGAASLALSRGASECGATVVGVDNSEAMLNRCQAHLAAFRQQVPIELHLADINDFAIEKASVVVLNFTLQFLPREQRQALIERIYQGLLPGGALVLSEKICFEDSQINQLMIDRHHQFKRQQGYSELEISGKRNALENVLLPDTLEQHRERLKQAGFSCYDCWHQQYNFVSLLAIK